MFLMTMTTMMRMIPIMKMTTMTMTLMMTMMAMMPMMPMIAGALAVCLPSLTYGLHPGERAAVKEREASI